MEAVNQWPFADLCCGLERSYTPLSNGDTALDHPELDKPSAAHRVEITEFRVDLAGYLRQARQGASFLVTSNDEVLAELRLPSPEAKAGTEPTAATPEPLPEAPRGLSSSMRGRVWMADDWDTWPEGFIEEMTEGPILLTGHKGG